MNQPDSAKARLRFEVTEARRNMPEDVAESLSGHIVSRLESLPEVRSASTIHTYLPSRHLHEVNIMPLILTLVRAGVQIAVPVVKRFSRTRGHDRLMHSRFDLETELRPNRWGIPEPVDPVPVDLGDLDLVIVPALACDRLGYRLGFGFGYYDEFLQTIDVPALCPCYDAFLRPTLPHEEHDRPVDIIVTELTVLRPYAQTDSL